MMLMRTPMVPRQVPSSWLRRVTWFCPDSCRPARRSRANLGTKTSTLTVSGDPARAFLSLLSVTYTLCTLWDVCEGGAAALGVSSRLRPVAEPVCAQHRARCRLVRGDSVTNGGVHDTYACIVRVRSASAAAACSPLQ